MNLRGKFSLRHPLSTLAARWRVLKPEERKRYVLALSVILLGGLALFHALVTTPTQLKAERDLIRVKGRVSLLDKQKATPPVPRLSGKSPMVLAREVQGLETRLVDQRARLTDLEPRFLGIDDLDGQQQQRLAITALAGSADMEMLTLEQKGIRKEEKHLAPTPERMRALAEANLYKRPLLHFEARASYRGLMQFLDGLSTMNHAVSPVWLSVEVKTDAREGKAPSRQWLEVAADLAL
jgi:hypothetical protein